MIALHHSTDEDGSNSDPTNGEYTRFAQDIAIVCSTRIGRGLLSTNKTKVGQLRRTFGPGMAPQAPQSVSSQVRNVSFISHHDLVYKKMRMICRLTGFAGDLTAIGMDNAGSGFESVVISSWGASGGGDNVRPSAYQY